MSDARQIVAAIDYMNPLVGQLRRGEIFASAHSHHHHDDELIPEVRLALVRNPSNLDAARPPAGQLRASSITERRAQLTNPHAAANCQRALRHFGRL